MAQFNSYFDPFQPPSLFSKKSVSGSFYSLLFVYCVVSRSVALKLFSSFFLPNVLIG